MENILKEIRKEFYMQQGQGLFDRNKYKLALEKFNKACNISPLDPYALLWSGLTLAELECYEDAVQRISSSITLGPGNSSLIGFLARVYIDQGKLSAAEELLLPVLKLAKLPRLIADTYGLALICQGRIDEGYHWFFVSSDDIGPFGNGSRILLACENYISAHTHEARDLDQNLSEENSTDKTHNFFQLPGTFLRTLFLQLIFLFKPSRKQAHYFWSLAKKAIAEKDFTKGMMFFNEARKLLDNDINLLMDHVQTCWLARNYRQALDLIENREESSEFKNSRNLQVLKAVTLFSLGEISNAQSILSDICSSGGQDPYVEYKLGLCYSIQGANTEARYWFSRAIKNYTLYARRDIPKLRLQEAYRIFQEVNNR